MVGTLSLGRDALKFCPPSILLPIPCVATDDNDIIYADRITNEITALRGNDIAFANVADTREYVGKDDDLLRRDPETIWSIVGLTVMFSLLEREVIF